MRSTVTKNRKFTPAFSLIELMIVILILSLLAAVVLPNLTGRGEQARQDLTCVQIKSVAQALRMFNVDKGHYPTTEQGLEHLAAEGYFEDGRAPKDPWGNAYIYILNNGQFEIISFGPDQKEGGEDDILYSTCQ